MKKVLLTLLALTLVIGLVGAGTIAYFSDTETSSGNTFTAGTLNLTVDGANDPLPVKFDLDNLKPGDSGTETYVLRNAGNIAGFVDLSAVTVANAPGTTPEPEPLPDAGELGANMNVVVTLGTATIHTGTLNDFVGKGAAADVSLAAGASTNLVIAWSIPTTVGNVIQDDTATVGITFELAQTAAQ